MTQTDQSFVDEVRQWRETREKKLRADNGWLTLAGRFTLKSGSNSFGTGKDNDVVFPPELEGTGPARLGTLKVNATARQVTLKLAEGVTMQSEGKPFTGERVFSLAADKRDWVSLGRISMYVIERDGKYVLRLADNESLVRKNFPGCLWYPPNQKYQVAATFVPYPEDKTLSIVNVIDETSQQPAPGYLEFQLDGATHRLDAISEGEGMLIVFRDDTSKDTTYPPSRFIFLEKRPKEKTTLTLDFNKAYNPPCAFSDFTTCPLPPKQNILKFRIEAGEKYRKHQ